MASLAVFPLCPGSLGLASVPREAGVGGAGMGAGEGVRYPSQSAGRALRGWLGPWRVRSPGGALLTWGDSEREEEALAESHYPGTVS